MSDDPKLSIPSPEPVKQEHGAQNILTGAARAAARGGAGGDIISNTLIRDAAVGRGEAGDGMTPDGSTPDGRLPPDVMDGADKATFSEPGKGEGDPAIIEEEVRAEVVERRQAKSS